MAGWRSRVPLGAVLAILAALLLVPVLIRQERTALRTQRINIVQPANRLATRLDDVYARQAVAYRNHLITGDRAYLDRYLDARRRELRLLARLEPLIQAMGPEFVSALERARAVTRQWQSGPDSLAAGGLTRDELIDRTAAQQRLYDATLDSARQFGDALATRTDRLNARIDEIDRNAFYVTLVLTALALAAAVVVVWLDQRRRRYARDLEANRDELAAAIESRAVLIRGFSHDMKNPLAAADGYLELLTTTEGDTLSDPQRHYIERARRSIDASHRLADNLVTLARVEAGQMPVERAPVDLCEVAREAAEDYRGDADMSGLQVTTDLPPTCPPIHTDSARVNQILSNLLSNAIRYTPSDGHIAVRVAVRDNGRAPGPGPWACIDVSDTGPGIPPDRQETIFDEFERIAERGRAPSGAGLGLTIGRRLARLLGGDLDVESEPGRGSTFTLWLPLRSLAEGGDEISPGRSAA